jgi:hypothetical protein
LATEKKILCPIKVSPLANKNGALQIAGRGRVAVLRLSGQAPQPAKKVQISKVDQ